MNPRRKASMSRHLALAGAGSLLVAGVLLLASCQRRSGVATADLPMRTFGSLRVGVANTPDPPRVGENRLTIVLRDGEGNPVRGAAVDLVVSMPAMGAMPYMESRGKAKERKPGAYVAEYGLSMNGEWDVNPRIRPGQGAPVEAAYRLSTSTRGLSLAQGAEPAGSEGRYEEGMPGMSRGPAASGTAPPGGEPGITGTILIDAARRQEIGVKTARVEKRDLSAAIRAVGRVSYDEKRQAEMAPKFSGWIRELHVDYMGQPVRAGDVLAAVYSPELWSAQQEYIEALRNGPADSARAVEPGTDLAWAARRRLLLWDIAPAVIEQIAREGKPRETIPIVAPASGVVIEKSVVLGSAFTAGQVLYRIAPLDPAWVIASVYQVDLPLVRLGMPATLSDPYLDERSRTGRISFIHPALEAETRTAKVRIEIPNPRGDLKPGAFVNVELETRLGKGLAVPASAVLPTGERRIVFVDLGDGRLAPRDVRLGVRAGDYYQVLDGLVEGDVVVTSGNFLVAAESKLRSAAGKW